MNNYYSILLQSHMAYSYTAISMSKVVGTIRKLYNLQYDLLLITQAHAFNFVVIHIFGSAVLTQC
jgi:hypothetical protein